MLRMTPMEGRGAGYTVYGSCEIVRTSIMGKPIDGVLENYRI